MMHGGNFHDHPMQGRWGLDMDPNSREAKERFSVPGYPTIEELLAIVTLKSSSSSSTKPGVLPAARVTRRWKECIHRKTALRIGRTGTLT